MRALLTFNGADYNHIVGAVVTLSQQMLARSCDPIGTLQKNFVWNNCWGFGWFPVGPVANCKVSGISLLIVMGKFRPLTNGYERAIARATRERINDPRRVIPSHQCLAGRWSKPIRLKDAPSNAPLTVTNSVFSGRVSSTGLRTAYCTMNSVSKMDLWMRVCSPRPTS